MINILLTHYNLNEIYGFFYNYILHPSPRKYHQEDHRISNKTNNSDYR